MCQDQRGPKVIEISTRLGVLYCQKGCCVRREVERERRRGGNEVLQRRLAEGCVSSCGLQTRPSPREETKDDDDNKSISTYEGTGASSCGTGRSAASMPRRALRECTWFMQSIAAGHLFFPKHPPEMCRL